MLAKSNCTSARAPSAVTRRSPMVNGTFIMAATRSPESPRRTETLPFIKLIRATPRSGALPSSSAGGAGFIAGAGACGGRCGYGYGAPGGYCGYGACAIGGCSDHGPGEGGCGGCPCAATAATTSSVASIGDGISRFIRVRADWSNPGSKCKVADTKRLNGFDATGISG